MEFLIVFIHNNELVFVWIRNKVFMMARIHDKGNKNITFIIYIQHTINIYKF